MKEIKLNIKGIDRVKNEYKANKQEVLYRIDKLNEDLQDKIEILQKVKQRVNNDNKVIPEQIIPNQNYILKLELLLITHNNFLDILDILG